MVASAIAVVVVGVVGLASLPVAADLEAIRGITTLDPPPTRSNWIDLIGA